MKKLLLLIVLLLLAVFVYGYFVFYPQFPTANGYAAKKMCSCTFIADRTQESIQSEDLGFGPLSLTKTKINLLSKSVTSSIFGLKPRTAVYRNDVGCILIDGVDDYATDLSVQRPAISPITKWPQGSNLQYDTIYPEVNMPKLTAAIDGAFDESIENPKLKTRGVVVIYKDQLIAEKYADGFDADTEILGWSMTKSITGTLIGVLAKNGKLNLRDQGLFDSWTDERSKISLKDMMQMQSGLAFEEVYDELSDATKMLYTSEDASIIPRIQFLEHEPGTHWSYSSGTTNLLSKLILDKVGNKEEYLRFPYDTLFNRIGMNSAVMETDESGLYTGSSYCYATPRDWGKLGLLYLNDGNWYGDQIIDKSWVDFVRTPASDGKGIYGGQFWLNAEHSAYPDVPDDMYSCNGFQGQYVFIFPSHDLVVVRMGLAEHPVFDINEFLKSILGSISQPS